MMFIAGAGELLTAYISLELLSFCLYILASYARDDHKSNEAGLKYILLGALATALLLLGISLVYGYTGSTFYRDIAVALAVGDPARRMAGARPRACRTGLQGCGRPVPAGARCLRRAPLR
jgi:NADH:ubiquinone oxidoreductase subunit 2 (subunit N)